MAVESALIFVLFLLPTLVGLADCMVLIDGQSTVDEALQDTMTYVMNAGQNANTSSIQTAAQASNGSSVSVSTNTVCYCVSTNTTTPTSPTSISCTGTCSTNAVFQRFMSIQITTQVTVPFPLSWMNLASPYTLSATGLVRAG